MKLQLLLRGLFVFIVCAVSINASAQSVSLTATHIRCHGGSDGAITASASGGTSPYTYLWSNAATNSAISGLAAGTYSVTVTDDVSATATASVTVTEPSALSASISSLTHVGCYGGNNGAVTAAGSGGTTSYSYRWSTTSTNSSISSLAAGGYAVTITDANGCVANTTATVTQPMALSIAKSKVDVLCAYAQTGAASVTVTGGTASYSYAWSNGRTTSSITGLAACCNNGQPYNYVVTVTDANGCTASTSLSLTMPFYSLQTDLSPPYYSSNYNGYGVSIFGNNDGYIHPNSYGGTSPYTYLWSTGSTSLNLDNLTTGTYSITVTDNHSCVKTTSITLSQPSALSIDVVPTHPLCSYDKGSFTVSAAGGISSSPYTYYMEHNGVYNEITNNPTELDPGDYHVSVEDANGATATVSITLTVIDSPYWVHFGAMSPINCYGGTTNVDALAEYGSFSYSYLWSTGQTTYNLTSISAGPYTVTVTDSYGCIVTASMEVTQPSQLRTRIAASHYPNGYNVSGPDSTDGSLTAIVSGAVSPYAYAWATSGAGSLGTDTFITGLGAGLYFFTVTDYNGCSDQYEKNIQEPTLGDGGWGLAGNNNTDPDYNFIGTTDSIDFVIKTDSIERMHITANGNVGIGSSTVPAGYKLAVGGKIICEELEILPSANWPDYVFKEDYKLMSLHELKEFISENNHLPDVYPAKEVQGMKGLGVGDMQAKLLQKIEELTLYLLQQNDEIVSLKKQVSEITSVNK